MFHGILIVFIYAHMLLCMVHERGFLMAWHAQPSGGYLRTSSDAYDNMMEIYNQLSQRGYTVEAVSGILGNVQAESGFNPWRWQNDRYNVHNGYGLYQYTPASGYISLTGATPNLSVTTITTGATPEDGARQTDCFADNELGKWVPSAWRTYWNTTTYATLYAKRNTWLSLYGYGNGITISQFAACTDIEAATFFFLACFEGPRMPNLDTRYGNAAACYEIITGSPLPPQPDPPTPTPPDPPPPFPHEVPPWLIFGMKENNLRRIRT